MTTSTLKSFPTRAFRACVLILFSFIFQANAQANIPTDHNLFVFSVDASIADKTQVGSFEIPSGNSSYRIVWEEVGNESLNNSDGFVDVETSNYQINFGAPGIYRIAIDPVVAANGSNDFDTFSFGVARLGDELKMLSVEQWGTTAWSSMSEFVYGASNFTGISAADIPDLSALTSLRAMFAYTPSFSVSAGIRDWQVTSVTSMADMFQSSGADDIDVSLWDVSSVESMIGMFANTSLNPDVSNWDVSSVQFMQQIFANNPAATPNTANWDVSAVLSMSEMFRNASSANPDTSNWNTGNVESFDYMFADTTVANPDTSSWNLGSAIFINHMFQNAAVANPDTSNWITPNVSRMQRIFQNAANANPDVSNWDFSALAHEGYDRMFDGSGMSTFNYDAFLNNISNVLLHSGIYFQTGIDIHYCTAAQARQNIMDTRSWFFGDGGFDCTEYHLLRVLEDSISPGGSGNSDGVAITGEQIDGISGLDNVNTMLAADYQLAIASEDEFSNPPLVSELQVIIDSVNTLYEILEDSQSPMGSENANDLLVTALDLLQIPGLYAINTEHEPEYQYFIAEADSLSNLPSRPEIQSIVNAGNAAALARQAVREDSVTGGGSNNQDGVLVTASVLSSIVGIQNVRQEHELYYQWAISHESSFDYSGLPLIADIQAMIDNVNAWVNAGIDWRSDPTHFKFTLVDGVSDFQLPTRNSNFELYWEEVGSEWINNSGGPVQIDTELHRIDFGTSGTYRISIDPVNTASGENDFNNITGIGDIGKIYSVEQWGSTVWSTMSRMFQLAGNFVGFSNEDIDVPNLSMVTDMSEMFGGAEVLVHTNRIGDWNVSNVTNMYRMFAAARQVNPDISNWDVSSVNNMGGMFSWATEANSSLSDWDVSSVTNMDYMFFSAGDISRDIGGWNTSAVTSMTGMFSGVTSSPDVSAWDVSSVVSMNSMFAESSVSGLEISSWDVSNVTDMNTMFFRSGLESGDIPFNSWNLSSLTTLQSAFPDYYFAYGNYDELLLALERQNQLNGVVFHQPAFTYCTSELIRTELVDGRGWIINDGGRDCSRYPAYEILEDSDSGFGSRNQDGATVTAIQIEQVVDGEVTVNPSYEEFYQSAIAAETNFSYPPTVAEVANLVNRVNIVRDAFADILEDSRSPGGSENADGVSVDLVTLERINDLVDVHSAYLNSYQRLIAEEMDFSNPPTTQQIQQIIDRVNEFEESLTVNVEDTDNDGIPNAIEMDLDSDDDGIFDHIDHDSDNDGIPDSVEGVADTDADGIADFRDIDSDNDGVFDLVESQFNLELLLELDRDLNGMVDSSQNLGANGMADRLENAIDSGDATASPIDTDADNIPDFLDPDSDNDGIYDVVEAGFVDTNRDGVIDSNNAQPRTFGYIFNDVANTLQNDTNTGIEAVARDTDGDTIPDTRDRDSDNDGLLDIVEAFGSTYDQDNDGQLDDFVDADMNGVSDQWQLSDLIPKDTDSDGQLDQADIDSDGDGLSDIAEYGGSDSDNDGMVDNLIDTNADGIDDGIAVLPVLLQDTDADGIPDFQDIDSNNDGVSDFTASGAVDLNGDGQADSLVVITDLPDLDADGIADYLQLSSNTDSGDETDSPSPSVPVDSTDQDSTEQPVIAAASGGGGSLSALSLLFITAITAIGRRRKREAEPLVHKGSFPDKGARLV